MASSAYVRFSSFTIDAATRTPITVPAGSKKVIIRNADLANAATLYDADVGGNSIPLAAGTEHELPSVSTTDATVVWAQADAGTGPIRAEYFT